MEVNYFGPVSLINKFLPIMVKNNEGMICNVASAVAVCYGFKTCEYVASKHAIYGFHNCLRLELKK